MRVILLGKPGSGKGTQAQRLATALAVPAISSGDLMRKAAAAGTALGRKFQLYTERGELVPDDLVLALIGERLSAKDCGKGYLLDGFPRTLPQAEALARWTVEHNTPIDCVVNIEVPDAVLVERAGGRRYCPRDGATYHVQFAPPKVVGICDRCQGPLAQRDDDREEVVEARLAQYREKTEPLIAFYAGRGTLRQVDGVGSVEAVSARIERALG